MSRQRDYRLHRLRRGVIHIHPLGPRVLSEFLDEFSRRLGIEEELLHELEKWRRLTPAMVRVTHGDRWPPIIKVFKGGLR